MEGTGEKGQPPYQTMMIVGVPVTMREARGGHRREGSTPLSDYDDCIGPGDDEGGPWRAQERRVNPLHLIMRIAWVPLTMREARGGHRREGSTPLSAYDDCIGPGDDGGGPWRAQERRVNTTI